MASTTNREERTILDDLLASYTEFSTSTKPKLQRLAVVLERLNEEGIDCILLKGADLIPRLYGVLGARPLGDVDLLVHEADLPALEHVLKDMGLRPIVDGNPSYLDEDHILSLDIVTRVWYLDDMEELWARADRRIWEGIPVKGMGTEDLVLYLTAYSVVHRGCVSPAFGQDLALLVEKEPVDWARVVREAIRHHLKIPLVHGLAYAAKRAHAAVPSDVLSQLAPSSWAEKSLLFLLRRVVTETKIHEVGHLLLWITRPRRQKLTWLKEALFPSDTFMRYRYGQRADAHPVRSRMLRPFGLLYRLCLLVGRVAFALARPR
jgi:hypothetical protein